MISSCVIFLCGREDVFRKTTIIFCILRITLIGCVVWVHHQYTVGIDLDRRQYFRSSTIVISIPTGIKVFRWLISISSIKIYLQPILYWTLGFISLFTIGGVTGIILSNTRVDIILHDTYFTTSHFHQVLRLGSVFGIFRRVTLYLPLLSGLIYSNIWINGRFWLIFIGVNITFLPQYILGINGLPRKYPEYRNFFYTIRKIRRKGSRISIVGGFLFVFRIVERGISVRYVVGGIGLKLEENSRSITNIQTKHEGNESICVTTSK